MIGADLGCFHWRIGQKKGPSLHMAHSRDPGNIPWGKEPSSLIQRRFVAIKAHVRLSPTRTVRVD